MKLKSLFKKPIITLLAFSLVAFIGYGCDGGSSGGGGCDGGSTSFGIESQIEAGGTIPAGTYRITRKIVISKSGLTITANDVIIDARSLTSNSGSGDAITITGSNNHLIGISVTKAGHNGICITGKANTVENCKTYANGNTGLNLKSGAGDNLITGCISYDNYDYDKLGEDADGFGVKAGSASGNRFVNCESYNNSDDGWDFWDNQYGVRLENCYAHNNGAGLNGDGNGFKLGNTSTSANHYLLNCTAKYNRACGFTQNGNRGTNTYINCISIGNGKADVR